MGSGSGSASQWQWQWQWPWQVHPVIRLSRTIKNVPREIRPMFWTCYNYNRLDYFNIYIDITVNDFICTLYLFYGCESKTDLTVLYRRFIAALW